MARDWVDRSGEMEVFAAIVERGSFSAAGRLMGLSPSAVSRIVGRLETRLGVRLVHRTTRALALTPEGEAYHRAARRILSDLTEAERAIADQATPRGRIRVNATLTHGRLVIVPLLGEFLERYPGITVDISLTDTKVDLVEERTDVAIRVGPLDDSSLVARRLGDSGRTVIASPAYLARRGTPQVPEDLLRHNCIGFNFRRAEPLWPFRLDGREIALTVTGNVEANNGETVAQLAREGVGIGRVGSFHVAQDIAAGHLVPLLEAYNPGDREPIHALFAGGPTTPARVRAFVDYLAEKLA
ncbi:LysR family transcriptional regulator [Enterovirga rhinocerotis]|uniref:LysR family transcriptional regulator n=1 Tax=Enterovirga rhinocerotis TaxID=1339210 RepID=A0A4R7BU12_9HYPH|nr:LysR family transcriptional regulator [Enterovirga rhinocerotis]TDR88065.1 LysR family transcriptional regulator [Enterovirga rhinocerotis]